MLLRLLVVHMRPYRRSLATIVVLQLVATAASLNLPSLNADIIDRGIVTGDTRYILATGTVMLAIAALQVVVMATAVYVGIGVATRVGFDLRSAIFRRVGEFSSSEVARFGVSSLIIRCTNDVQQIQLLVNLTCTMLVTAPITCVGGVIMALHRDAGLSWIVVVGVLLLTVPVGLVARRMIPSFRSVQRNLDILNRVLREQIIGVRIVRAFGREEYETARFGQTNEALTASGLTAGRLLALVMPLATLVLNLSCIAVLWFGAMRVDAGLVEIGSLTAYLGYLLQILMSVVVAAFVLMTVPRAAVGAERIMEVLRAVPAARPRAHPVSIGTAEAEVDLRDVAFCYTGAAEPVLRDITFRIEPGRTTAIVGGTGAGKTTVLSLVSRLLDVSAGAVRFAGEDVQKLDPEVLWSRIALVPQKPYLFSGTVASNLRYGRPEATDAELWDALEIAQARSFVETLPDGLAAPVLQGGTNFSGGQRQRLTIARALVKRPRLYLFDDPFSALDLGTEARLRSALHEATAGATVAIVSQRIWSIADADQIVVLDRGQVMGIGTHRELLVSCPTYAEIVESQPAMGVAR